MIRYYAFILPVALIFIFVGTANSQVRQQSFKPGEIWTDNQGSPINAHGGGMLYHKGKYYWFGEIKQGKTWRVEYITTWECYRTNAGGVSCYSSDNLIDWKYEGVALAPDQYDATNDLHISKVIERPKVIYNEKTKKFVMWMHIDSEDYSYARAGVAISDTPTGPYTYLYSLRPNNQMSRDMTLFKDTDGKAYHIFSSENNEVMHVAQLTGDYLKPTGLETRIFIGKSREAPALFKHKGRYYLITSGCTGWAPNEALIASTDNLLGNWTNLYNPCRGENSETTYLAQSTYIFQVEGKSDSFIFMADRWNKTNLEDSRYVWLPIEFEQGNPIIKWQSEWNLKSLK